MVFCFFEEGEFSMIIDSCFFIGSLPLSQDMYNLVKTTLELRPPPSEAAARFSAQGYESRGAVPEGRFFLPPAAADAADADAAGGGGGGGGGDTVLRVRALGRENENTLVTNLYVLGPGGPLDHALLSLADTAVDEPLAAALRTKYTNLV